MIKFKDVLNFYLALNNYIVNSYNKNPINSQHFNVFILNPELSVKCRKFCQVRVILSKYNHRT